MTSPHDDQSAPAYVDVTIVEFAAHTAFLDPVSGVGYLVMPSPVSDVDALEDPLVEAAWSERLNDRGVSGHLSLHGADRDRMLSHLADIGWALLYDEDGLVEVAGRTRDGREALCLYGESVTEQPTLDALDCAIIALDIAANLDLESRHPGEAPPDRGRPGQ